MLLDPYVQLNPIGEVCKEAVVAFHKYMVRNFSHKGKLDRALCYTLEVFQQFLCNQIWLIWLREEVDWMEIPEEDGVLWRIAIPKTEVGWEIPIPDASQFNDGTLAVASTGHCLVLDIVNDFQNIIDARCKDKPSEAQSLVNDLLFVQWYHLLLMESFSGELVRRWEKYPKEVKDMLGIVMDSDAKRQGLHFRETLSHLKRITQKYRLPADYDDQHSDDDTRQFRDEKAGVLQLLIAQQISPLQERDWCSQVGWAEQNGQRLIPNIFQGLQKTFRKQYAQKRQPDVIANREYMDAEIESEDGYRTVLDELVEDYPDALTHQPANLTPEMSQQRLNMAKAAFGKTGARVLEAWYKDPDATQAELAKKLSISLSTVEKYIKQFRGKGEVTKKILEM